MRVAITLLIVVVAAGCYHDKYDVNNVPKREEYVFPPDQPRFNEPESAPYRAPPTPKKQETLLNRGNQPIAPTGRIGP